MIGTMLPEVVYFRKSFSSQWANPIIDPGLWWEVEEEE